MELITHNLSSALPYIDILPLSDLHLGSRQCNVKLFKACVDWIVAKPNRYTWINGDFLDLALSESVGDNYDAVMRPNDAFKYLRKLVAPLKDRVLGITEGNHEWRLTGKADVNLTEIIADDLNAYYNPDGVYTRIRLGKGRNGKPVVYTIYFTHGTGGGRESGGKLKNSEAAGKICLADLYSIGHVHKRQYTEDVFYVPDHQNGGVLPVHRRYISTGSFLEYGGYGQRKVYTPTVVGAMPKIRLDGRSKHITVTLD